jgi:hypothetical protein
MRKIWMPSIVAVVTLAAGIAAAQTPPPPAPGGAFESLSPGNQKIATAIFDAQQPAGSPGSAKPLSLDEIAAMKQGGTTEGGKGWGVVWKDLRSQGLVQGNLGQVVSRTSRGGGATAAGTEITTGSGKTAIVGGTANANGKERPGTAASGRQANGSGDAVGNSATSTAVRSGRDGGVSSSAAHASGGSHGGSRGK